MVLIWVLALASGAKAQCRANIDLNTWIEEGPPSNVNWVVNLPGTQLTQTINSYPTVFVSPQDFINVRINGTIRVNTTGDDQFFNPGWNELDGYYAVRKPDNPAINTINAVIELEPGELAEVAPTDTTGKEEEVADVPREVEVIPDPPNEETRVVARNRNPNGSDLPLGRYVNRHVVARITGPIPAEEGLS